MHLKNFLVTQLVELCFNLQAVQSCSARSHPKTLIRSRADQSYVWPGVWIPRSFADKKGSHLSYIHQSKPSKSSIFEPFVQLYRPARKARSIPCRSSEYSPTRSMAQPGSGTCHCQQFFPLERWQCPISCCSDLGHPKRSERKQLHRQAGFCRERIGQSSSCTQTRSRGT